MVSTTGSTSAREGGSARRRGPYAPTSKRQAAIVEAAMEAFASQGYRTTSTRDVAELAGISEAGLRHHFPTKTDLLRAVLAHREQIDFETHVADPIGIGVLRSAIDVIAKNASTPSLVELYTVLSAEATDPEHPARDHFAQRYAWVGQIVRDALETMQREGQLVDGTDPASLSRQMIAVMDGLQIQWLYHRDFDMADEIRRFLQVYVLEQL